MKPFMEKIECPVLSANIKTDKSLPKFSSSYLPYKIFTVDGQRVGVVGYTSRETPALSKPGEWSHSASSHVCLSCVPGHTLTFVHRTSPAV